MSRRSQLDLAYSSPPGGELDTVAAVMTPGVRFASSENTFVLTMIMRSYPRWDRVTSWPLNRRAAHLRFLSDVWPRKCLSLAAFLPTNAGAVSLPAILSGLRAFALALRTVASRSSAKSLNRERA